jgi:hypothetical protein
MSNGHRIRAWSWLCGAVLAAASCFATLALAADGRFGWLGLAPAEAGQTLQQVESTLGAPLQALPPPAKADGDCQKRAAASQPGVVYIVDKVIVTRVETRDARYATVSGVRVGDDAAKAQRVYGKRLTVTPHIYFAKGKTMAVYSPDRKFALVMESNDAGRIITLRGGLVPAVEYLEGCSG